MQMLATLDISTNETTPTKFVDEEGHDCTPFFMIRAVMPTSLGLDNSTNLEPAPTQTHSPKHTKEGSMPLIGEMKALRLREEVSIRDLSPPTEHCESIYNAEPEIEPGESD